MKNRSNPKRARALLCTLVLSALVSACESARRATTADTDLSPMTTEGDLRGNPDLESRLEVLDPRMRASSTGRILAFDLRNKSATAERILYVIEWFDRRGERVADSRRVWNPLVLEAGAVHRVEVAVPVPEAESWRWHAVHPASGR